MRIVQTAAQLMFERGVGGTSVEDVLLTAGVSASQLYHYFGDKQSLVRAVIAHQTETMLALQAPALDALDSFEALRAWRDLLVEVQRRRRCEGGCALGSLASELADADALTRADIAAGFAQWEGRLRDGLLAMRERGIIRPDADPHYLALAILTSLQGGMLLTQLRRDAYPLEVALDSAIAYVQTYAA
jgi:TetR/AcrR family transcriptional regulator, transcriptional repressor for nem operon